MEAALRFSRRIRENESVRNTFKVHFLFCVIKEVEGHMFLASQKKDVLNAIGL